MPTGYSGKPTFEKLGLSPATPYRTIDAPEDYLPMVEASWSASESPEPTFTHWFVTERAALEAKAVEIAAAVTPGHTLWISWPKRASGIHTDVTEDVLRDVLLPLGIVDVKVCAVDDVWSGLKFLRRRT